MNQESPPDTRHSVFLSFLLVAGFFTAIALTLMFLAMIVLGLFYPDQLHKWSTLEHNDLLRIARDDPSLIFPTSFCWILIVGNAIVSFIFGVLIARFAPSSKLAHGCFLAIAVLLFNLQNFFSPDAPMPKWMILAVMISSPIAILYGAKLFVDHRMGGASSNESNVPNEAQ